MEWWLALLIILGSLLLLMISGLPTAFCFMMVTLVGAFLLWGGQTGFNQLILNIRSSITSFGIAPLILFVLMGSIMFQSSVAPLMITAVDKFLGRLPGRLSLMAVLAGTLFATLSGSSMGSTAMLGSVLVPEMEKHGYQKPMSLGPILGSGGLAMMIPPSSLGVFLAVIAEVSVAKVLIAIIVPGLMMAFLFGIYVLVRCWLQPFLAPAYNVAKISLSEKLLDTVKYILPLALIIFLVTGVIFLGIATPTEAAATGCLGAFILAAAHGQLTWQVVKKAVTSTLLTSVMVLLILASSTTYSQILAFSGASRGAVSFVVGLEAAPIMAIIGIQLIIFILGCFMDVASMMMIVIPLYMPIVNAFGFDPVWFVVITLLNLEMSTITPPFGFCLFVMKGVAPPSTTMEDIYKAGLPFVICDIIVMVLLFVFPVLTQWLPGIM